MERDVSERKTREVRARGEDGDAGEEQIGQEERGGVKREGRSERLKAGEVN